VPHSVLIVDDEPSNTELFSMMLKLEGYQPHVANDAQSAWAMMAETEPEVVILDIMMPGVSGLEFCQQVRSEAAYARTPIVVVSAKDQLEDVEAAMSAGATIYLVKPVSKHELLQAIEQALAST
jgi:CheY-like chemotaxis protein